MTTLPMTTLPRTDTPRRRVVRLIEGWLARRAARAAERALRRDIARLDGLSAHLLDDIGIPGSPAAPMRLPHVHSGRSVA